MDSNEIEKRTDHKREREREIEKNPNKLPKIQFSARFQTKRKKTWYDTLQVDKTWRNNNLNTYTQARLYWETDDAIAFFFFLFPRVTKSVWTVWNVNDCTNPVWSISIMASITCFVRFFSLHYLTLLCKFLWLLIMFRDIVYDVPGIVRH